MKTVLDDIKAFISAHKTIIYTVVLVFLLDHFFLGGSSELVLRRIRKKGRPLRDSQAQRSQFPQPREEGLRDWI